MSLTGALLNDLGPLNIKPERFREIVLRLMAYGVVVREDERAEQLFYDDAKRVQPVLEAYFDIAGLRLHHDVPGQFFRLYAPGAEVDGLPADPYEPVPSVRASLSPDFVAAALVLRLLYEDKLRSGDIQPSGDAFIKFEDIASAMQAHLKRPLPAGQTDKLTLLGELKRHRLLHYNAPFVITDEDAYLVIRPTILGVVNEEALGKALDAEGVIEPVVTVEEGDEA